MVGSVRRQIGHLAARASRLHLGRDPLAHARKLLALAAHGQVHGPFPLRRALVGEGARHLFHDVEEIERVVDGAAGGGPGPDALRPAPLGAVAAHGDAVDVGFLVVLDEHLPRTLPERVRISVEAGQAEPAAFVAPGRHFGLAGVERGDLELEGLRLPGLLVEEARQRLVPVLVLLQVHPEPVGFHEQDVLAHPHAVAGELAPGLPEQRALAVHDVHHGDVADGCGRQRDELGRRLAIRELGRMRRDPQERAGRQPGPRRDAQKLVGPCAAPPELVQENRALERHDAHERHQRPLRGFVDGPLRRHVVAEIRIEAL